MSELTDDRKTGFQRAGSLQLPVALAWQTVGLFLLVLAVIWLPRGLALDRFVTPDEAAWMGRSASFYDALMHRDFAGTFQHSHPGVTATWAGALAFRWHYPSLASQATEKTLKNWQNLQPFLEEHGYRPIEILKTARALMALGTTAALGLAFLAALRLIGLWPALLGFFLIALDPFHTGLTRLLHLDGLMSSLMLLSTLSFFNYVYRGRHNIDLALASISAGLAWLTKNPALFLGLFFGLVILIEFIRGWRAEGRFRWRRLWPAAWLLLAWTGMSALVFVLLWPAMWVEPLGTLQEMFGRTLSYAAEGHSSAIFFNGRVIEGDPGPSFYPLSFLWRTTPAVLAGLLLAGAGLVTQRAPFHRPDIRRVSLLLASFALLFGLFMSLGAKKFDRYLLPGLLALDLLAGMGCAWLVSWARERRWGWPVRLSATGLVVLAFGWQALLAWQTYPYYLSYYNPLLGGSRKAPEVMMIGWGEGLDEAARFLNTRPQASNLRVMSHYPDGPFSYFFDGQSLDLLDHWEGPGSVELAGVDYLVLYIHQWQRQRPDPAMLAYFAAQTPEYVVRIDGLEYARVYNLDELRP